MWNCDFQSVNIPFRYVKKVANKFVFIRLDREENDRKTKT